MNVRQGLLLRELLSESEYKTCVHFAESLGCSEKTIRNDLKAIDAFLDREGFSACVQGRRGMGIRLEPTQSEANRLSRLLDENEVAMRPRLERLCQEIITLTCWAGTYSVERLSRQLYTNKKQIREDLQWWSGILKPYGIALTMGRSLSVVGSEWALRRFVMSILFSCSSRAIQRRIEPFITEGEQYDQVFYERSIDEAQAALGFRFSGNARWQLIVYLKIMVARVKLGFTIPPYTGIRELSPYFLDLCRRLERHFSISISLDEMRLLQDMHDCSTWQWSLKLMEQYEPNAQALALANSIVDVLEEVFQGDARPATKALGILIESGLTRRACGFTSPNPNEHAIKYDAMDGFCLLSSVLNEMEPIQRAALHSADYTRVVQVLIEYLDRSGYQRRYRAGLVVNCGIDLALHGKYRIENQIPKVKIADIVTEDEVQAECGRFGSDLSERFDFLISFDPIAIDFPCVAISPAIAEKDIRRIVSAIPLWRSGKEAGLPWESRTLRLAQKEHFVDALCKDLQQCGDIEGEKDRFRWVFETLCFVKGGTLVFTLCDLAVKKTGAVFYRAADVDVSFGKRFSTVAVLLARVEDRQELTPITEQFKCLLEEHADIAETEDEDSLLLGFLE